MQGVIYSILCLWGDDWSHCRGRHDCHCWWTWHACAWSLMSAEGSKRTFAADSTCRGYRLQVLYACMYLYIYIHVIVPIAHQPFVGVWSALCWCLISSKNQIKLEIGENSAGLQYLNCLRDLQLRVCCYNLLYANCFYHILDADAERIQMNAEGLSLVLGPETLRCTGSAHSRLMMPLPLDSPPCMVEAALPWDQHLVVAKKIWM